MRFINELPDIEYPDEYEVRQIIDRLADYTDQGCFISFGDCTGERAHGYLFSKHADFQKPKPSPAPAITTLAEDEERRRRAQAHEDWMLEDLRQQRETIARHRAEVAWEKTFKYEAIEQVVVRTWIYEEWLKSKRVRRGGRLPIPEGHTEVARRMRLATGSASLLNRYLREYNALPIRPGFDVDKAMDYQIADVKERFIREHINGRYAEDDAL